MKLQMIYKIIVSCILIINSNNTLHCSYSNQSQEKSQYQHLREIKQTMLHLPDDQLAIEEYFRQYPNHVNINMNNRQTIGHIWANQGKLYALDSWINSGGKCNQQTTQGDRHPGTTPAHIVLCSSKLHHVSKNYFLQKMLTKFPALTNLIIDNQTSLAHICATQGNIEGLKLLAEHGANFSQGLTTVADRIALNQKLTDEQTINALSTAFSTNPQLVVNHNSRTTPCKILANVSVG